RKLRTGVDDERHASGLRTGLGHKACPLPCPEPREVAAGCAADLRPIPRVHDRALRRTDELAGDERVAKVLEEDPDDTRLRLGSAGLEAEESPRVWADLGLQFFALRPPAAAIPLEVAVVRDPNDEDLAVGPAPGRRTLRGRGLGPGLGRHEARRRVVERG